MPDKENGPGPRDKLARQADNSLRGKAIWRALRHQVPKTLTPYEWEAWYAENGVPEAHSRAENELSSRWRKFKAWWACKRCK